MKSLALATALFSTFVPEYPEKASPAEQEITDAQWTENERYSELLEDCGQTENHGLSAWH